MRLRRLFSLFLRLFTFIFTFCSVQASQRKVTCLGFQKRFVYKWQIIKTNLIFATGLLFQPFFFSFSRISFPTTSFHQYLSFSSTGAIRDGATMAIFCSYNLQISHKHLTCKTPTVLEATNTHMHVHALPHTHTIYNFSINYKNDHVVSFFLYFFTFVFKLHTQSLDIWKCAEISLQRSSFIWLVGLFTQTKKNLYWCYDKINATFQSSYSRWFGHTNQTALTVSR